MATYQQPKRYGYGGAAAGQFNDVASYVTDTSSITNPVELDLSYSDELDENPNVNDIHNNNDDVVSFVSSATSALTGLTGWTSAMGGGRGGGGVSTVGMEPISEMGSKAGDDEEDDDDGEENFLPLAHSKSYKSDRGGAIQSEQISAISFDLDVDGSVETSLGEINVPHSRSYKSRGPKTLASTLHSKGSYGSGGGGPSSPTSSVQSSNSHGSKKRAPVPPLRDPNMDDTEEDQMWEEDCNYDINPTLMFLVLESRDWKESIALLDGKGLENKNEAWNLGALFGGMKKQDDKAKAELKKKQQKELKVQARTWITRREKRSGVLRWRMLPLHAALAFNAPFDVVLRLYHLYPGAVRCRNDQGMLPLHHCFKYGNEDKVLELFLDVFPEALTVVDDKGRLPIQCTPKDGSDNERRSNIMTLFCNFQVELVKKGMDNGNVGGDSQAKVVTWTPMSAPAAEDSGTLGAAPRYTTNTDYNQVTYSSIKPPAKTAAANPSLKVEVPQSTTEKSQPLSPKDDGVSDRYALVEDSENNPILGNGRLGGLSTIPEDDDQEESLAKKALKSELLALRESKKKGLKRLFRKKKALVQI